VLPEFTRIHSYPLEPIRQPGNSPTAGCLLNAYSKNVAYGWRADCPQPDDRSYRHARCH